jgi:hypothetical protein
MLELDTDKVKVEIPRRRPPPTARLSVSEPTPCIDRSQIALESWR